LGGKAKKKKVESKMEGGRTGKKIDELRNQTFQVFDGDRRPGVN